MQSKIQMIRLDAIDSNPMRMTSKYPYKEAKIEALQRSMQAVGLWAGVIGRQHGNRIQLAFGHHRIEAARRMYGTSQEIPVIVQDLSDEQMIQFMGRENLEDYNADFLVMLESWQAGQGFLGGSGKNHKDIDIARLLGWTRIQTKEGQTKTYELINDTAEACSKAAKLIAGGYLDPESLADLSSWNVREIVARIVSQHEVLERMAKKTKRPAKEIEVAKKQYGRAGSRVARDIKAGKTARRDIRGQVDIEAYRFAKQAKQRTPLFAAFAQGLCDSIARVADSDAIGERLREIEDVIADVTMPEDIDMVEKVVFECGRAAKRFDRWTVALANPGKKIVKLTALVTPSTKQE